MKIDAYWDINALEQIKTKKAAAKAFEEEFVHMLLKEARKTLPKGGILGESFSSKIYFDMFDMQLAHAISQSDQLGLQEYIENALEHYKKNSQ